MPDAPKETLLCAAAGFDQIQRVGLRQRACGQPDCQAVRRVQTQKSWRDRNRDYFIARRIQVRGSQDRPPEPLRLPPPLNRLLWNIAQDEFGVKGADFIGVSAEPYLGLRKTQFRAYPIESTGLADTLHPNPVQDQIRPVRESVRVGMTGNEAGVSPNGSPL
jgi:hypothetical protein